MHNLRRKKIPYFLKVHRLTFPHEISRSFSTLKFRVQGEGV